MHSELQMVKAGEQAETEISIYNKLKSQPLSIKEQYKSLNNELL